MSSSYKDFILLGPCCAVARGQIGIRLLTSFVFHDATWPQFTALFYEILLLKLSLQIIGQNKI